MTPEEAIDVIKHPVKYWMPQRIEADRIAVEALERFEGNKELVYALRCSATVGSICVETCPYRLVEEINPKIPVPADVIKDGVGYWITCDFNGINIDAADALDWSVKE